MNIRSKLIILFVSIVAFISLGTSVAIYFFSADYREDDFYRRLENKGKITARLLIEVDEVDEDLLKKIEKDNPISLPDERIIIYDFNNEILYTSDDDHELSIDSTLLDQVRLEEHVKFRQGEFEVLGFLYTDKYDRFVVVVGATDIYGLNKLRNLRFIMMIVFAVSIFIIFLSGFLYVGNALKPISKVIEEVDDISATSLHRRVNEGNGKDEISRLAYTFNNMLKRIQTGFISQKQFIANASHELRNPLTGILGQIDVALLNSRKPDEYQQVLRSLREDINNLKTVSNRLLLLAQASVEEAGQQFTTQRCDQILWEAKSELLKLYPEYSILIELDPQIDDDSMLNVEGDEQLLKGAFINLMDNACKYSANHKVQVSLYHKGDRLLIEFRDSGIGISDEDKLNIFEPFYRGRNSSNVKGHGIGLSLVYHIIRSHKGNVEVKSVLNSGTTVAISLPLKPVV